MGTPETAQRLTPTPAEVPPSRGMLGMVGSTDHKSIAGRIAAVSMTFFVVAGVFILLVRTELLTPNAGVIGFETFNQMFTMHGSTMLFIFLLPMIMALGIYIVPLQLGASELAAPRLALLAFWLLVGGATTMYWGFFTQNGPGVAGWTAYPPLSNATNTPGDGMMLWIFGVILCGAASTFLGYSLLATIIKRRAPGMTMLRMPVLCWTMFVSCILVVAAFPALLVAMFGLMLERQFGGIFSTTGGPIAYQNIFWFFGHPVVYVLFFPFLGIAAEIFSAFSRKRFFGYHAMVVALLAFTALSMSVWAHHMFTTGQVTGKYFALLSTALIVPAGIEYFDSVATLWRGKIRVTTPLLFAAGFLIQFLIGGVTGIFNGSPTQDYHLHDSYWVIGHFHYTLFAGSMFALIGGLYYWFPKFFGVYLNERIGKLNFTLAVIGTNLTFFPMFFLGYDGMPRRIAEYSSNPGWQDLNIIATVGSYIVGLSVLVLIINVVRSLIFKRQPAPDDPWDGGTLEWATSSPPPRHNFDKPLPEVRSYAPLWDEKYGPHEEDSDAQGAKHSKAKS